MNVLFCMSTSFQTTSRHLLISILDALSAAGHQVTVIKKKVDDETEELPEELQGKGIQCISIPCKAANKGNLAARYVKDLLYIAQWKKYLKTKYDAVFVQSSNVAGFVFRMLRRRQPDAIKTFNVQDTFPDNAVFSGTLGKNGLVYRLMRFFQGYAYRKADHIITISEDMKQFLAEEHGVEPAKIQVVYNWSYGDAAYEKSAFDRDAVAKLLDPQYFQAVYAGNIGVMQNVDVIIEAARRLKDDRQIWFTVIGNGVYREKLQARAREYGITNISFLPMQPASLAPSIYGLADVNIIPLGENVYKTALPSKTATCMACGKPIIFAIGKESRFGQRAAKETGCFVVDSNDAEGLAAAITAVKNGTAKVDTAPFFLKYLSMTENSGKYANIITKR